MTAADVEEKPSCLAGIILAASFWRSCIITISPRFSGWEYPANTYFFSPANMFNDWVNLARKVGAGNPYVMPVPTLPPLSTFRSHIFSSFRLALFLLASFCLIRCRQHSHRDVLRRWLTPRLGLAQDLGPYSVPAHHSGAELPLPVCPRPRQPRPLDQFSLPGFHHSLLGSRYWLSVPFLAAAIAIKGIPAVFFCCSYCTESIGRSWCRPSQPSS